MKDAQVPSSEPTPAEQALRARLATAATTIDCDPDDAWDTLQARLHDAPAGTGSRHLRRRAGLPRTRLLIAAAVVVAILGTALMAARSSDGGDDGDVDVVDDTTTTSSDSQTTSTTGPTPTSPTTPLTPGDEPAPDGADTSRDGTPAGPAAPGSPGGGLPGAGAPPSEVPTGGSNDGATPTGATTSTPEPPPRAAPELTWDTGDYTVELVYDPHGGLSQPGLYLRRTDDVGTPPAHYEDPDAYGWFAAHSWSLSGFDGRCDVQFWQDTIPAPDHVIVSGRVNPGIASVAFVTTSGERRPLAIGPRIPDEDVHAVLGEPPASTNAIEVADAAGTVLATIPYPAPQSTLWASPSC